MNLYQLKGKAQVTIWVDLDSITQVEYRPVQPQSAEAASLTLWFPGGSQTTQSPADFKAIGEYLGITIPP
jgi:hypothetical protein